MQYPVIDLITSAYINNGWTGLDIPQTITYEPIQLGSGDPSPDNVRPILPATTLNIGGVDVPVYGGMLDVTTGVLTVDRGFYQAVNDGQWKYAKSGTLGYVYRDKLLIKRAPLVCSCCPYDGGGFSVVVSGGGENGFIQFWTNAINIESVNDWLTFISNVDVEVVYKLTTPVTYQLTPTEVENTIGSKDDIAHRLKLPLPHYFPHPVIDALQRAAAGTQTADDTEILRHYLTPLGIGGI